MKEYPILFSATATPPQDRNNNRTQCNKSKIHSNHQKCGIQRPTEGIARRTGEKTR